MRETFVIMAGGTGGHVFPGLAVAKELKASGYQIEWLGTQAGIESSLVPKAGYPLHCLPVSGVRGRGVLTLLKAPFMIIHSVWASLSVLRKIKPVAVMGFGGFAAGPGAIAARLLGKPLILHEQNSVLGTTNGMLQYIASKRLEGFPDTFSKRRATFYTGNPVRDDIAALQDAEQAVRVNQASSRPVRVLVFGGSRGARALNENMPGLLAKLQAELSTELDIRHQTGRDEQQQTEVAYQALPAMHATVTAFIDDMAEAYLWADVVVCRAGAMTVAELTLAGRAAVLVPFPHAIDDHQTCNARWLERNNAAVLVPQAEIQSDATFAKLLALLSDQDARTAMANSARSLAVPDSASLVARHCLQLAGGEGA